MTSRCFIPYRCDNCLWLKGYLLNRGQVNALCIRMFVEGLLFQICKCWKQKITSDKMTFWKAILQVPMGLIFLKSFCRHIFSFKNLLCVRPCFSRTISGMSNEKSKSTNRKKTLQEIGIPFASERLFCSFISDGSIIQHLSEEENVPDVVWLWGLRQHPLL